MELEDEYPGMIREMLRVIDRDRDLARAKWPSAYAMAATMRPDSPHNHAILDILATPEAAYLRITPARLISALNEKRHRTRQEIKLQRTAEQKAAREEHQRQAREANQKHREDKEAAERKAREDKAEAKRLASEQRRMETFDMLEAELGGVPVDERQYIDLWWAKRISHMAFDRVFYGVDGRRIRAEQVVLDAHLTAASLNLVKPRGDLLAATNIERALAERVIAERQGCLEQVSRRVATLPEGVEPEAVLATFEAVCGWYFKEPLFANATLRSLIRQTKRMLRDLPVAQRRMGVFVGEQNAGKTFVQRALTRPICDVVAEASLKDVLDERQMELPEYGVILLDEMVSADRADMAALKNFITGLDYARRPMRTNAIEKIKIRATLLGTSNHSLGKLIFDSTGMRRFVELAVRPRSEIEPFWSQIIAFNWLELWQAVDDEAEDPLVLEFSDLLMEKQEELRTADNTELWVRQFEPTRHNCKTASSENIEYFAGELYDDFREFEMRTDRGWRGTSLTRWGRELKSLIDAGSISGWSHHRYGPKTFYRIVLADHEQTTTAKVVRPAFGR